jgi:hypothetical protein
MPQRYNWYWDLRNIPQAISRQFKKKESLITSSKYLRTERCQVSPFRPNCKFDTHNTHLCIQKTKQCSVGIRDTAQPRTVSVSPVRFRTPIRITKQTTDESIIQQKESLFQANKERRGRQGKDKQGDRFFFSVFNSSNRGAPKMKTQSRTTEWMIEHGVAVSASVFGLFLSFLDLFVLRTKGAN